MVGGRQDLEVAQKGRLLLLRAPELLSPLHDQQNALFVELEEDLQIGGLVIVQEHESLLLVEGLVGQVSDDGFVELPLEEEVDEEGVFLVHALVQEL